MKKLSLPVIGLLQALGLIGYISLVTVFISNAERWLGPIKAPVLPLALLVLSALSCGLISLTYPIILIWDRKQTVQGAKLVIYTALWMFVFFIGYLAYLALI